MKPRPGKGEVSWAVKVVALMDSLEEVEVHLLAEESNSAIRHCVVAVGMLARVCGCNCEWSWQR